MPESDDSSSSVALQSWLDRHQTGDGSARRELMAVTMDRLRLLAKRILADIPGVKRWEDTDDLLQNASIRLWKALESHRPPTQLDFFRLAACLMRRELVDMSRSLFGPLGLGANCDTHQGKPGEAFLPEPAAATDGDSSDPHKLSEWTEFHEYIDSLPDEERVLYDLLWYQGLTMNETSALTGIPPRTLGRRWKTARVDLYKAILDVESRG